MASDNSFCMEGNIVDVAGGRIFSGEVVAKNGRIVSLVEKRSASSNYILPGLIDAHVHVESSMLVPSEFARLAVVHGTVATVSDPHEIGNVLGINGVRFMLENAGKVPFKFYFGAPSCVPATCFESAGACIGPAEVEELLALDEIRYLSEMMNFPGVLNADPDVWQKIRCAQRIGKVIDGHAPGLRGENAKRYIDAGISTDHECFTYEEAQEKLQYGMKIIIREGSAAKNFAALIELLPKYPDRIMFCSDDKHPNDLVRGHINALIVRAQRRGVDPLVAIRAATLNPVQHYGLGVGLLRVGDAADCIVVSNLADFAVRNVLIDGVEVARDGKSLIDRVPFKPVNNFKCNPISQSDIRVDATGETLRVIQVIEGQLVSAEVYKKAQVENGAVVSSVQHDVLKIVVVNRYRPAPPALAFVSGIGLKRGALASSVAHDSHNIVAVGASDLDLISAVNALVESEGGVSLADGQRKMVVPLPVAGLMSDGDGYDVAKEYELIDAEAKRLGSPLPSPFMTLSFLALLVIPKLKLSDRGLFDGERFQFVPLFK